ncbi:MAG: type 4a pilus biogenesis protein PilO [bacterium]
MELSPQNLVKLDRSKKIAVLVGTILLVCAAYVWLFFLPTRARISELDGRLGKLLDQKAEQEAIAQNLQTFKQEYERLESSLRAAMSQLPNKKEIPTLLENISNLGRESGLELPLFRPGLEQPKEFYAEVPIDIKLVGPFQNMLAFYYSVGELPRIVNITELTVERAKGDSSPPVLEASCKALTYKFLEEAERAQAAEKSQKQKQKKRNTSAQEE